MIDHVSDTFVDPCVPLTRMVAAAKQGNKPSVDQCADQFLTHAEKIVHVSICIMHVHTCKYSNILYTGV